MTGMCARRKLPAPSQEKTRPNEGKDPHNHTGRHASQESGIAKGVVRRVGRKMMQQVREGEGSEEHGNSTQNVQDSHGSSSLRSSFRTTVSHNELSAARSCAGCNVKTVRAFTKFAET